MVRELLSEAGIALSQCDAIAFGSGPGSFTGVRTACGVVQGLAFGAGLPVVPVVTLEAMAEACREASGALDVLPVLDARMGEVYWARYRHAEGKGWLTVAEPALSRASEVDADSAATACGNGLTAYADAFAGRACMHNSLPLVMPHARQVARLGQLAFAQGHAVAAQDAQPLYLRNKVAMTVAERMAKATA